jgi:hypothetical protein
MHPFIELEILHTDDGSKRLKMETIYANTKEFADFVSQCIDVPITVLLRLKPAMDDIYELQYDSQRESFHERLNQILSYMGDRLKIGKNYVRSKQIILKNYREIFRTPEDQRKALASLPFPTYNQISLTNSIVVEQPSSTVTSTIPKTPSDINSTFVKMECEIRDSNDHKSTSEAVLLSFKYLRVYRNIYKSLPEVGIRNEHMNCCINSIVQCLFRLRHFQNLFRANQQQIDGSLLQVLSAMFESFSKNNPKKEAIDGAALVQVRRTHH